MNASLYPASDQAAARKHRVRDLLNRACLRAIAAAAVNNPKEIAREWGLDRETAEMLREAAKRHVRELWAFEEAGKGWDR